MSAIDQNSASEPDPDVQELAEIESGFQQAEASTSPHLRQLIQTGKVRGYVTPQEVLEAHQAMGEEPWPQDAIYADLFDAGINIAKDAPATEEEDERAAAEDPMRIYLREIRRVPLLAAGQEAEMGRRIAHAGLSCKALLGEETRGYLLEDAAKPACNQMPIAERDGLEAIVRQGEQCMRRLSVEHALSKEELRSIVREGEEARRRLTEANLRLVVSVARRYVGLGLSLLDLIQEGNVGLLQAVEKYDASKGCRFSTYAVWWIRHAIMRSLAEQSRTIRIPGHIVHVLQRLSRASRQLLQQLGREPQPHELAGEVGLSEELVTAIMNSSKEPLSLEIPTGPEEDDPLRDSIRDDKSTAPELAASRQLLREQLHLVLAALTRTEREVLAMRFGLKDGRYHTLEETGRILGMTRERIRQTEGKALRKLRHPTLCNRLRDYMQELR